MRHIVQGRRLRRAVGEFLRHLRDLLRNIVVAYDAHTIISRADIHHEQRRVTKVFSDFSAHEICGIDGQRNGCYDLDGGC